ncbi:receptor-type tyrosine-protein phosphatase C [Scomber scombrus]|uniref:Receptor-type tyrosine-protein phosphatase C n=1 Tax=Scomber scombrus TaxID=13677 RepID=A0AAV1PWU1_SCOSC
MARVCGLKILLFWAGIICLANSVNSSSTTSPPLTSSTTLNSSPPLNSSPTLNSSPPLNSSPTLNSSPPRTTATSAVSSNTQATTQTPSPTLSKHVSNDSSQETVSTTKSAGSYTVTPFKTGFTINFQNAPLGNYNIHVKEKGQNETGNQFFQDTNQSSLYNISNLKPCTDYEHVVTFSNASIKTTPCNNENTKTNPMNKSDIKPGKCDPGYLCFNTDWNIGSEQITANNIPAQVMSCPSDNKTFCIKPSANDICTDLKTTVTAKMCVNSSFNFTNHISAAEFLNSSEIKLTPPTGLPANIEAHLHQLYPNCTNLTIDYNCSDSGNNFKNLSELEPFTDYTCIGQIKENNVTIKDTTAIHVRVDCDLQIKIVEQKSTNTSINLKWTTTSLNCEKVLPELENLSYDCRCHPEYEQLTATVNKQPRGGTCEVFRLTSFTDYTCSVQPKYNNQLVSQPTVVTQKTGVGVPADVGTLKTSVPEHNVIKVTCPTVKNFFGPKTIHIANLTYGGVIQRSQNNHKKCEFEFKDLSYSTDYVVEVVAFNGHFSSKKVTSQTVNTLYNDKAVIGFLVFLIILTSVALLVVIYKIYILRHRKSHDMTENLMLISQSNDEDNLLTIEPIAAEVLLDTYKRKLADEGRLFLAEFQSIPRIFSRYTVKEAKKVCNAPKNRYVDILPYDYNRVGLTTGNGETGCDYINASFIDGYKESKKYIAAQGPKEETVSDFWRMIWEQQSSIIVMVTRCEEGNRVKCAQYWPSPDRETEIYEEFVVKLNSEDHCPDYTIRHLSLTNRREKNSEREVTHIQFMSWPDHGVPGEPHLLLKLRRRVNAFKNFFSGPIVVHCSAGVGRTGTYICIDAMMEGLEAEGRVDIYGYVVRLRRQRCLMVQVEAQYILIHQALLEHNQFGETEIPLSELHSTLSMLHQKNSDNESTLLDEEFGRLPNFKNWRTFNTGITEENKSKNRSSSVIPYDYNRVLLKMDEGRSHDSEHDDDEDEESSDEEDEESTKYINASHLEGYWSSRTFIAAQTPLPDTIADFWSMIHQKKASTVVMLSDSSEGDEDSVYWDKEKKTFGEIEVEVTSTDISPTFVKRNMQIRHVKRKEGRSVKHFQFLKWVNTDLPEKSQDLTDMIKDIKQSCGSNKSQGSLPIVVHCNDGSSRSGIFCALWTLLDSAESEKLVDVFQVVKTIRKERQGMFSSMEQYKYLYDAVRLVYPVQNGEVKGVQTTAQATVQAATSVQIVNETEATQQSAEKAEKDDKAEQSASNTISEQQGEAESTPLVADGGKEDKKQEPEKGSSGPTETTPLEDTSNGTTVTVEV